MKPRQPTAMTKSPASAVNVPSAFAPTRSRWTVACRFPLTRFSSRRVSAQRTGRPVRLAISAAMNVYSPGWFFAPKPPPMKWQTTRTLSSRDAELLGGLRANAPDELRRGVEVEDVAFPLADRLVRLHRVVQDGLRPVLGLDHDVGLGEAALDVAAVVALGLVDQRASPDRLVGVEQGLEHLPLDVDQTDGRLGQLERVGRDGRDRAPW